MKYLTNDRNIVRDADLTATNIVASNVVYRTDDDAKQGGGQVTLTGDYDGAEDTTIDIKIVDTTITGTPKISAPEFSGIGNGTLTDATADSSMVAQRFTITLEDLGTATLKAYAPFQGVTLRAKAAGTSGNDIAISIDNSALTLTPTPFATQHDATSGTTEFTGDEWNFGASILNADQTIPDSAPRISFGADPQVYRQYKFYRNGQYVYGFSPTLVRDVPKGTVVNAITGSRSIEILNAGVPTDSMTAIVTLYDALSAIRDDSTLIEVVGAIINDKTAGGQGMVDLSVWTSSYVTGVVVSGSDAIAHAELIVLPDATAPTETLTLTCTDATSAGGEKWTVRGDVSGRLADATTAEPYSDGHYSFTIPSPEDETAAASGSIIVEYVPESNRDNLPTDCFENIILGSAARSGTWEFVYTKRPVDPCDCSGAPEVVGGPDANCLGIELDGGTSMLATDEQRSRQIVVDRWFSSMSAFLRVRNIGNVLQNGDLSTDLGTDTIATIAATYRNNIAILSAGRNLLSTALADICASLADDGIAVWTASKAYVVDAMAKPVIRNGLLFRATIAGTSGSSEPSWPALGATVSDGSVTWVAMSLDSLGAWEQATDRVKLELGNYCLAKLGIRANSITYGYGSLIAPASANGHWYMAVTDGGTSDSSAPTYPTSGGTVTDGTVVWQDMGVYWVASTKVAKGTLIITAGGAFEAFTDGTTGSGSEPGWTAIRVIDGSVTWHRVGSNYFAGSFTSNIVQDGADVLTASGTAPYSADPVTGTLTRSFVTENGISYSVKEFTDALKPAFAEAYAIAGIGQNFDQASTKGDGCWQDENTQYWWAYQGTDIAYLPIQTGFYYNSASLVCDGDGSPAHVQSTKEFGFGPKFACAERLVEGDIIRITISEGTNANGYQQADSFAVSVLHAVPLPLGGGQTGDDTLTFSVFGDVAGRLPDYALVTTALTPYDDSGHLGFQITPGGIAFALGDIFGFSIEGGHFEWRQDGGSWSSSTAIADTVSLVDGLSANFSGGAAPSWVDNDQWSFKAEAINGVDGVRQPTDARLSWTGSTTIIVDPGESDPIDGILIADHTIPSDATITLLGSDDNFSTTPFSQVLTWRATHIFMALMATRAKYKLTVNRTGSIQWLWLGGALQPKIRTGLAELGVLTKRWRMPSLVSRRALGAQISHSFVSQDSIDDFVNALSWACENDDQRLAIVPNDTLSEVGMVQYATDTLELNDEFSFQPSDASNFLVSLSLQLDPIP